MKAKLQYLVLSADLLCIAAGCVAAGTLQDGATVSEVRLFQWTYMLAALSIWSVLFRTKKLDGVRDGLCMPRVCAQVIVAGLVLMGSLCGLTFLFKHPYSLRALVVQGFLMLLGLISIRCLARWLLVSRSYAGSKRRVIILGAGCIVRELALRISRHPETAMEIAGVLSPSQAEPTSHVANLARGVMSVRTLNILALMQEKGVRELIVVEPLPPGLETAKLIANCRNAGIKVHLVPQRYELYLSKAKLMEIDGIPLLSLERQSLPVLGLRLKRGMDLIGAALLLILSIPVLAFLAGTLYWKKGRVFRKELRCGKNGRLFGMHRLDIGRDASNLNYYERVLLQFSLTELPQLWNILRGEMSLVGPRPESADRVKHYSDWQRQRLSVTPGLTGLAQVHGLREQHSSEEKARFDLEYIFQWSLFLDLSLLLQTIWLLIMRIAQADQLRQGPIQSEARRVTSKPQHTWIPNS